MELDTSKLTEGQIFNTYPELCRTLGCEVYGGYQKTKQLKDFGRYFNYEKDGKKIIITEIYPEPMNEEYRVAANAKYVTFVQNILLSYLSQQEEEIIYITPQRLWLLLGMVNNKYLVMKQHYRRQELLTLSEDMDMFDINHFFVRSNMKIRDILKSGLGSLLVALGIGAGLGVLFAPKSGKETREELKVKIDDLINKLKTIDAEDIKDSIEEKLEELQKELKDLDKEKVLATIKKKAKDISKKADELVNLAVEKGTPVVEKAAKEVKAKTAEVLKNAVAKLEETEADNKKTKKNK